MSNIIKNIEELVGHTPLFEFVKYQDILPKESQTRVVFNKNDFLESIERASLLAKVGKNNLIKLDIRENNIEITSKSEEGNVKEDVYVDCDGNGIFYCNDGSVSVWIKKDNIYQKK